ncbi:hypothetical protein LTR94_035269, partial [Friedmanniomyces endolithicus]
MAGAFMDRATGMNAPEAPAGALPAQEVSLDVLREKYARGDERTIEDVQHIVVHMQENRAFDHYLGMLNGVRGFGDPRPLRLAGGRSVFAQPSAEHPDGH